MAKVFISTPMNGLSDEAVKVALKRAEVLVKEQLGKDVQVINSFFENGEVPKGVPLGANGLYLLGRSFELLSECDAILMYGDWICARGCMMEFLAAKNYGIEILKVNKGTGRIVKDDRLFHNFKM